MDFAVITSFLYEKSRVVDRAIPKDKVGGVAFSILDNSSSVVKESSRKDPCNIEALMQMAKAEGGKAERVVVALEKTGKLTCDHFIGKKN
ncbi:MAG: hypothetical protein V4489_07195 [Chlamydiota bacterium]